MSAEYLHLPDAHGRCYYCGVSSPVGTCQAAAKLGAAAEALARTAKEVTC